LTREDDGEEDEEDELSIDRKRRENYGLIYEREREGKPNADTQSRSPMPSTSAEPSSSPWGQMRPMGAGGAGGGRRVRWGQARLVGAGEANGGCKPPATCPSPPAPNTREATVPNPKSTLPLWPKAFQTK